jgi:predicted anti-sigma-YlaC factor YlaD
MDNPKENREELTPVNLEQQSEEKGYDASEYQERRRSLRLKWAGWLAGSLWLVLLSAVVFQCTTGFIYSQKLSQLEPSVDSVHLEKAIQITKEAAQDVYTFLTPLATAITAFFFGTQENDSIG